MHGQLLPHAIIPTSYVDSFLCRYEAFVHGFAIEAQVLCNCFLFHTTLKCHFRNLSLSRAEIGLIEHLGKVSFLFWQWLYLLGSLALQLNPVIGKGIRQIGDYMVCESLEHRSDLLSGIILAEPGWRMRTQDRDLRQPNIEP